MQRYKSLVLPIALIGGYFLRQICAMVSFMVPYVIFAILVLTFSGVKLSRLRPAKLDLWIALFQIIVSFGSYQIVMALTSNEVIAQGAMMCVLCPVASSVTVVASMLGANPVRTTTYTIIGNLLVAVTAPIYISLITETTEGNSLIDSFILIFCKIAVVIALPFFVVLLLQKYLSGLNAKIAAYKHWSFYLWAFALFVTIGQTADFVVMKWKGDVTNVFWLGAVSLVICFIQFSGGRLIGKHYNDKVAGGQLLAQKNSAMGIWIINTFLNPIASVSMAFYSIWQNIFNSWQIYRKSKSK
ncbi:MAG: bile acid:sodium symporter [Muribaculaceae bacterium]|nr:bile acid:sodium symporter [Muribaculaceae bacterium]